MGGKTARRKVARSEPVKVILQRVGAPDTRERLRRAYDLAMRAAARAGEGTMQYEGEASEEPDEKH